MLEKAETKRLSVAFPFIRERGPHRVGAHLTRSTRDFKRHRSQRRLMRPRESDALGGKGFTRGLCFERGGKFEPLTLINPSS